MVHYLTEGETRAGHRQRLYGDMHVRFSGKAVEQLIGTVPAYTELWVGEAFSIFPNAEWRRLRVMMVPSMREQYCFLNRTWFRQLIKKELRKLNDCYVVKVDGKGEIE